MANFHVNLNGLGSFATLEEARSVAQAIDTLIKSGNGSFGNVSLSEAGTHTRIPLVTPVIDRSKLRIGGQEAEATVNSYVKYFEKMYGSNLDAAAEEAETFWAEFIATSIENCNVDLEAFGNLVSERLKDENAGVEAVGAILGAIASDAAQRTLNTALAAKRKAAKRPVPKK